MSTSYSKKQLTPIITKYGINPDADPIFQHIINIFAEQTPYQMWAIKLVYGKICKISDIDNFKQFAEENKTLITKLEKKNLVVYTTKDDISQLKEEILGLEKIGIVKHGIEEFNTAQREMLRLWAFPDGKEVSPLYANRSTNFDKVFQFFKKFSVLANSKKSKVITTASAIKDDVKRLIEHVEYAFNEKYGWKKEELLSFIQTNKDCKGVKVVYDKDNIVILHIPTFAASHALCHGETTWCITREEHFFKSYVLQYDNHRQYFYFDFSKSKTDLLSHIGFTVNSQTGITNAHDTNNDDMRSGIRYNGKIVNVNDVLAMANISQKLFMHLNGISGFDWDVESIIDFISRNQEISMCVNMNGRIVVRMNSPKAYEKMCSNTLIKSGNLSFDNSNSCVYVVLDSTVGVDDENCMVTMQWKKDNYGTLSLSKVLNAYGNDITKNNYLDKVGIPSSSFVNREKIKPSILLHKYIDEGSLKDAIKLISETSNELDVNFDFNGNTAIFKAIDKQLFDVFEVILGHSSFKSNILDSFGEPLLQNLIYTYRANISNNIPTENVEKMIRIILNSSNYDFNAQNYNLDTAVNVAAEKVCTNWILDILVQNPNVDINVVNDFNCTALGNAIRTKNVHAIEELMKREDVLIRDVDTTELAPANGINLDKFKPKANVKMYSSNVTASTNSTINAEDYGKIFEHFASSFASKN